MKLNIRKMKLLKIKHIVFLSFLLILSGCNKETGPQTQPDVFLSVSARAAHTNGEESINMDTEDFEDRVHSLAMLVFDSGTGTKIAEHVTTTIGSGESTYAFTTKITPGQRDFYFIANMPAAQAALSAITTKAEMDAFMQDVRELTAAHYLGASNEVGFPMARVYTNQTIASGGTASNPLPFKPNGESNVKLVRVVAKLEVILTEGVENLHTIELINANRHFRLLSVQTEPAHYYGTVTLKRVGTTNRWLAYMPEAYIPNTKWWGMAGNVNNQPINYFRITTKGGLVHDVPVITHDAAIPGVQYLPFAKGELAQKPDYMIYRNHHYRYQIRNLPDKIEIKYSITDWNVVAKDTYMGYGYNVEVDQDGKISITNTMLNCDPHQVTLVAKNGAHFGTTGNTTQTFSQLADGASATYQVNRDAVATGVVYLEVYYNRTPGTGIVPDHVFIKK